MLKERFYINDNVTIDLKNVEAIVTNGEYRKEKSKEIVNQYSYEVVFKNGVVINCVGVELQTQYRKYLGLS